MNNYTRTFCVLLAVAVTGCAVTAAVAKTRTFGTGQVSIQNINNAELRQMVTIVNDAGEYGGAYATRVPANLTKTHLSFASYGDSTGGAPRWSVPIDTDGNRKTTEGYAFLDALGCGGHPTSNGFDFDNLVVVSTDSADCKVTFGPDTFANWAAFVAANPTYRGSRDTAFLIADQSGSYYLRRVEFR
jgi:hypothetical protein